MIRLWISLATFILGILPMQAQADADLVHTIGAGETLISIAISYGVTLEQLLTLNDLDPEALLQIGQSLVILPAGALAERNRTPSPEPTAVATEEVNTVGGNARTDVLPPAPVIEADAPMMAPADGSPLLCFEIFQDDNHNGMMDPGEVYLDGGSVRLFDAAGDEQWRQDSEGLPQPVCQHDLQRQVYEIEATAPKDYALTSPARLRIDLAMGGAVRVEFGAKAGLESMLMPTAAPQATAEPARPAESSVLRQLSGVFVMGLAAAVLFSGLIVSIFIRGR